MLLSVRSAMMAAVNAGVLHLVHTPHFGWFEFEDAKKRAAGRASNSYPRSASAVFQGAGVLRR